MLGVCRGPRPQARQCAAIKGPSAGGPPPYEVEAGAENEAYYEGVPLHSLLGATRPPPPSLGGRRWVVCVWVTSGGPSAGVVHCASGQVY